jgi:DNA-binding NtrC family response regulator
MQRDPIEAKLFGDARNATFETGAFQSADGGTVVLENVDALPKSAQDRLLQAIESGDVLPVGATTPVPADVRVLATTSSDLQEEIREGRFREDLFLHLNVIPIRIPPLRNRREDIPLLVRHFAKTLRPAGTPPVSITHRAMEAMLAYDWPGNVRQLRNEMERLLLLVHSEPAPMIDEPLLADPIREADVGDIPSRASTSGGSTQPHPPAPDVPGMDAVLQPDTSLTDVLAETESAVIRRVLEACDGQITASADVLGLTRQGLYKKMKRLNIDASNFQAQTASA